MLVREESGSGRRHYRSPFELAFFLSAGGVWVTPFTGQTGTRGTAIVETARGLLISAGRTPYFRLWDHETRGAISGVREDTAIVAAREVWRFAPASRESGAGDGALSVGRVENNHVMMSERRICPGKAVTNRTGR